MLTAEDAQRDGLGALKPTAEANVKTGEPFAFMPQPLLATGKVRYVGEPLVLIIAETYNQALDAADLIAVDYVPLASISTTAQARTPGAPQISAVVPDNLRFDWQTGETDAVARFLPQRHMS